MAKDNSILSSDIELDGSNHKEWAFTIRIVVKAAGCDNHLSDEPPELKEDEATKKAWQKSDAKVMNVLVLNVLPQALFGTSAFLGIVGTIPTQTPNLHFF
jgi:hypothetical protein